VLVLGAGTGNDAAVALMSGATEVDAVEIDPVIARLGKERHPSKPYSDPGVNVIVDDARSFLRRTSKKYDMVVFGTLDSHALLSGKSTLRLDNFVYTTECFREAKRHLNERGVAVLMFSVPVKWIQGKLLRMTSEVFEDPEPLYLADDSQFLFNLMIMAGPGLANEPPGGSEYLKRFRPIEPRPDAGRTPTDDWPYLYLKERAIPGYYLQTIAILMVLSVLAIWRVLPKENRTFDFNFFALGCAFLLLETRSVTALSLIFGSTWTVNAFVFGTILLMIFLANMIVLKFEIRRVWIPYLCLGLSLLLNYFVPVGEYLGQSFWLRALGSSLVLALPLFFAGIIFARLFRTVTNVGAVFGANLIGAVLGGFLEYSSMLVGLKNLYIVAGCFYLISFILTRARKL